MKQTIFTVLGFLNEYGNRKIARCKEEVECFYPNEKVVADLFEIYLRRLADEHNLQTEIRREQKDTGHIYFYSEELNDLICSYYVENGLTDLDSNEIPKFSDDKGCIHYGNGKIGESIFPAVKHPWRLTAEESDPRLAFLIGAYVRYGEENRFSFSNAYHKARLVEELLVQLGSIWLRFSRNMAGVPTLHEIEFEMTEEMKQYFISNSVKFFKTK